MQISRYFTSDSYDYEDINWVTTDVTIEEKDTVVFHIEQCGFPDFWSQNACQIFARLYFTKANVPNNRGYEYDLRQTIDRVIKGWKVSGLAQGYFSSTADADIFEDEMRFLMVHQMIAPNTPQWLNTGRYAAYNIRGDNVGLWRFEYDDGKVKALKCEDSYSFALSSACFIVPVVDSLLGKDSITEWYEKETRIYKFGAGSGCNVSTIRAEDSPLSNGGKSSGLLSFLKVADANVGAMRSGGISRRGAALRSLSVDHPDTKDFARWKAKEERKVAALVTGSSVCGRYLKSLYESIIVGKKDRNAVLDTASKLLIAQCLDLGIPKLMIRRTIKMAQVGIPFEFEQYNTEWTGEAYKTVSGQNANNSIRVTDEFMQKVEKKDSSVINLWDEICLSSWYTGDPALQFIDTINRANTVSNSATIVSSNVCGEYLAPNSTSCNLASINLLPFLDDSHRFNFEAFHKACRLVSTMLDISVSAAGYPTEDIAVETGKFRNIGLGYMNLGALLMSMGFPYDSPGGRDMAACITSAMTAYALLTSSEIANELGSFPDYQKNKDPMNAVIEKQAQAGVALDAATVLPIDLNLLWSEVVSRGNSRGYRNANVTLLAPVGTIGLITDCDTLGIEPRFSLIQEKTLAGGGRQVYDTACLKRALWKLVGDKADHYVAYAQQHGHLEGSGLRDLSVFDCAVAAKGSTRFIEPMGHVRMVAAVQPFLSMGISKTINCPEETTPKQISDLSIEAWKMGCKSITVYRNNSKLSQPLTTTTDDELEREMDKIEHWSDIWNDSKKLSMPTTKEVSNRKHLPSKRRGTTTKMSMAGNNIYLRTGEYDDGSLGEIFIDLQKSGSTLQGLADALAIAISIGLQHGVGLDEYVEAYTHTRFEPAGVVTGHDRIKMSSSILDLIARDLAISYLGRDDLANGEKALTNGGQDAIHRVIELGEAISQWAEDKTTGECCSQCGSGNTKRAGSCLVCKNCGASTGCG